MIRTVRVTAGDRDHVYFGVTETTGKDISAGTAVVGFSDFGTPPTVAITPDGASDTVEHPATNKLRVGLFIAATTGPDGAHVVAPGDYFGWIKPTDTPATAWVRCGPIKIL